MLKVFNLHITVERVFWHLIMYILLWFSHYLCGCEREHYFSNLNVNFNKFEEKTDVVLPWVQFSIFSQHFTEYVNVGETKFYRFWSHQKHPMGISDGRPWMDSLQFTNYLLNIFNVFSPPNNKQLKFIEIPYINLIFSKMLYSLSHSATWRCMQIFLYNTKQQEILVLSSIKLTRQLKIRKGQLRASRTPVFRWLLDLFPFGLFFWMTSKTIEFSSDGECDCYVSIWIYTELISCADNAWLMSPSDNKYDFISSAQSLTSYFCLTSCYLLGKN